MFTCTYLLIVCACQFYWSVFMFLCMYIHIYIAVYIHMCAYAFHRLFFCRQGGSKRKRCR